MTRHGKIPNDIQRQLETNQSYTHGTCDECGRETRTKVEHPNKPGSYVCENCEVEVFMDREGIDPSEFKPEQ